MLRNSIRLMSKGSPFKSKVTAIEPLSNGRWIQTRKIKYTDPNGAEREWEMAVRTTRTETTGIDAVSIAAFLKHPNKPTEIVLTKQFRPPTEKVVIELPAGLIDPKESVESTAVRELLEETGYHGKFVRGLSSQIALFSDPGLTNANMDLAIVDVDLANPANQNPVPQLEDGEFIEVAVVPVKDLLNELIRFAKEEGCVVDSRLYHFALGIDLASSL